MLSAVGSVDMSFDKGKKAKNFLLVCTANLVFYNGLPCILLRKTNTYTKNSDQWCFAKGRCFLFFLFGSR